MNDKIKNDLYVVMAAITEYCPTDVLENIKPSWKNICQEISELQDRSDRRAKILTLVQDALGQLRLDMKYLIFDLESTRRERDALRENSNGWD